MGRNASAVQMHGTVLDLPSIPKWLVVDRAMVEHHGRRKAKSGKGVGDELDATPKTTTGILPRFENGKQTASPPILPTFRRPSTREKGSTFKTHPPQTQQKTPVKHGEKMVGATRFELVTFCTPSKRATSLRYAPAKSNFNSRCSTTPPPSSQCPIRPHSRASSRFPSAPSRAIFPSVR